MKISIGIPFYNPGNDFKDAINSVLQQTHTNFELILLNDGSSDDSLTIAKAYKDERIRVVSDGKNKGLPARLNELVTLSQGEFIARMDADDIIAATRLEEQVKVLNSYPDIDMVTTGICSITDDNTVVGYRLPSRSNDDSISAEDAILGNAGIAHATIMVRKAWYERNPYNEKAKLMEDFQLWIDAAIKNDLRVSHIAKPLYFYREEGNVSLKKSIRAYVNGYKIVFSKYMGYLPLKLKIKITILTFAKICFVFFANILGFSNKLLTMRNKNSDPNKIRNLQQELNTIKNGNKRNKNV